MNRPRKAKGPYPPCFYEKHGAFYLVKANKWTRLGADLTTALAEYGRLMQAQQAGGMPKLIDDAFGPITHGKAEATKQQYRHAAAILKRKLRLFEPSQVKSKHVAGVKASLLSTPNMANRVISVMRLTFAWAVEQQIVDSNPCVGVKRYEEPKRERLISYSEWKAIYAEAGPRLRVIMELQALTGQRIMDVLKIHRSQITKAGIEFAQQKTGAKLLVKWSPQLRATVKAANDLSVTPALTLLKGKYGKAPDYRSVLLQWNTACAAAGIADARLNDGRAMSATATKKQGKDATALLGHTSEAMTTRYLRDREIPHVTGPSIRHLIDVRRK